MPIDVTSSDTQGQNWVRNLNYYSKSLSLSSDLQTSHCAQCVDFSTETSDVNFFSLILCPENSHMFPVFLKSAEMFEIVPHVNLYEDIQVDIMCVCRTGWEYICLGERATYQSV